MKSVHSALFGHAKDLLLAVQGEDTVEYVPPGGGFKKFPWPGCIVGAEQLSVEANENGDVVKASRLTVSGPTRELQKRGVKKLERDATVIVLGKEWNLSLAACMWGEHLVRLELTRGPVARRDQSEQWHGLTG